MPEPVVSKDARLTHLRTMESLLISEGRTLRALRKATAPIMRRDIRNENDVLKTAREASGIVQDTLAIEAAQTRRVSLEAMRGEFRVARAEAVVAGVNTYALPPGLAGSKANDDARRAHKAAERIHLDMLKRGLRLREESGGYNHSASDLLPSHALDTLAATENAHTFHDERAHIEKRIVQENAGANWLPAMLKVHDATLDVRTCRVCRSLDGKWRPLGFDFPGGGLPRHNRCRCGRYLIFSVLFLGRKDAAEAA